MLFVTLLIVLIQFGIAILSPKRFIYIALWLQTMPYTWNFDSQLVYETPIGSLNVVAMQMFGFCLASFLALIFRSDGTSSQFKHARWHVALIGFCFLSVAYSPSVAYSLRMIAKLLGPFLFFITVLVVIKSEEDLRKMQTAILGSGVILIALALYARAIGLNSDPNAVQTGMSGLGPPSMGPPVFSAHMLPVAMLALAMFLVEKRVWTLLIAVASAFAILGALQRTSAGALYLGFSLIMFMGTRGIWRLLLPISGVVGLPALMVFSESFRRRMFYGDVTSDELLADPQKAANSINGSGRFDMWAAMLRRFFNPDPIFGSGIGSTQEYFYSRAGAGVVHSEYVRLMCEVGVIGTGLFALALASYLWRMQKLCRRHTSAASRMLALAAMGAVLSYAIYCTTDNAFDYVTQFGIYVFGLVAMAIKSSQLPNRAHQSVPEVAPVELFPNLIR